MQIPAPRGEGGKGSAAESATAGTFDYAALRHSSAPNARVAKRLRRGPYLRGGPVAPRTAKHAPHMTAGEPDHVIFPISPQREKQQCTLPIISPAVAATSCGVRGGGGCLKLLVMRALERDENAAQGIAQDLSKLLRQRILKEFKNKYGGKGPDSLQDGKSVTFNALLEQGKKINITIDSAAFAAWPRTAGPDRPRATRARPAPPPGSAGPAPRVAHEHRSTHTYRRSARGR